eukprot:1156169-Pelagomonas_calceolata.AAC.3
MVINTLYEEAHSLLSSTQAGFRNQKGTIHELQNVIMGLGDAKCFGKDVYAHIVSFTSAVIKTVLINTTDHDRMLWTRYGLNLTTDTIETVRNLFENATIQVRLPSGRSIAKIPVGRGTIQGDTLPPFLFLLCMAPLLRWLYVGGRGYKHG